jgi:hypothetical protein
MNTMKFVGIGVIYWLSPRTLKAPASIRLELSARSKTSRGVLRGSWVLAVDPLHEWQIEDWCDPAASMHESR